MRILHFSDPHIQVPLWRQRSVRELGPLRALASVELWKGRGRLYEDAAEKLRAIVRDAAEADHVICTGDLTQLALEEEFAIARETLEPLIAARRITIIPGNHDRYPLGTEPNRLYEKYFPEHTSMAPRTIGDGVALLPVDTVGELSWPVISHGRVSAGQLQTLSQQLRDPAYSGKCKLVIGHHSPTRRGGRRDWPLHDLRGATALMRTCAENGADALLAGHIHERFEDPPAANRPRIICAGSS